MGAGVDLRFPVAWERVTVLPGVRASLGIAEGLGPPEVSGTSATWVRSGWAALLAPRLGLRVAGDPVSLVVDVAYRWGVDGGEPSGVSFSGPSFALGVELTSPAQGPVDASALLGYGLTYSNIDNPERGAGGIRVSHRLEIKHVGEHLRLGADLVIGNFRRYKLGIAPGLRWVAFPGKRVFNPYVGAVLECGWDVRGEDMWSLVLLPGLDVGVEMRPFGGPFLLTTSAGLELQEHRSVEFHPFGCCETGFRVASSIGFLL